MSAYMRKLFEQGDAVFRLFASGELEEIIPAEDKDLLHAAYDQLRKTGSSESDIHEKRQDAMVRLMLQAKEREAVIVLGALMIWQTTFSGSPAEPANTFGSCQRSTGSACRSWTQRSLMMSGI